MATTVYSSVWDSNLRSYCTYDTSETGTAVTISGTIGLQHTGAAYTSPSSSVIAYSAVLFRGSYSTVKETSEITSFAKHTSWTTVTSTSFTYTINKTASTQSITFKIDVGLTTGGEAMASSYSKDISVSVPALEKYQVTYNVNGGSGGPPSQTKLYGTALTLSSVVPARQNYSFYHWNTAADNTGTSYAPGASYTANAALSLYAIWNPIISFDANGGTNAPATQTKTYGTALTLSSTEPTRAYATFVEWNTAADGTGTSYAPGDTYSLEYPVTLYAIWQLDSDLPSITSMTAIRWDFTNDVQKEDSTSAKVEVSWYIDTSVTNSATVTLTAVGPTGSTAPTITSISGTSGTSGTAIFRLDGVELTNQYVCTATVTDQYFSSSRSVYITKAYFIFDFKAGGGAVGFGRVAPASGLGVGYNTVFDGDVTVLGTLSTSGGGGGGPQILYGANASSIPFTGVSNYFEVVSLSLSAGTWLITTNCHCYRSLSGMLYTKVTTDSSSPYNVIDPMLYGRFYGAKYAYADCVATGAITLNSTSTVLLVASDVSGNTLQAGEGKLMAIKLG